MDRLRLAQPPQSHRDTALLQVWHSPPQPLVSPAASFLPSGRQRSTAQPFRGSFRAEPQPWLASSSSPSLPVAEAGERCSVSSSSPSWFRAQSPAVAAVATTVEVAMVEQPRSLPSTAEIRTTAPQLQPRSPSRSHNSLTNNIERAAFP